MSARPRSAAIRGSRLSLQSGSELPVLVVALDEADLELILAFLPRLQELRQAIGAIAVAALDARSWPAPAPSRSPLTHHLPLSEAWKLLLEVLHVEAEGSPCHRVKFTNPANTYPSASVFMS